MEPYIRLRKWEMVKNGRLFKVLGYGLWEGKEIEVTIGVFAKRKDAVECVYQAPKQPRWYV